jgi:adenylate cyclase
MDEPGTPIPLTAAELAGSAGVSVERVAELTATTILRPIAPDTYDAGDIHRIRAIAAFEAAGIPLAALLAASADEKVTFAYYDQLHEPPGMPSERTYAAFATSLGAAAARLPALYAAFGLAEPFPDSRLSVDEERLIEAALERIEATPQPDGALQAVRLFGDGTRRIAAAVTSLYAAIEREAPEALRSQPLEAQYQQALVPWARFARWLPDLARWLVSRHLSHAIDAFSVEQIEAMLTEYGFVPARPVVLPAVAFVDLAGFTELTTQAGDDAAASVALRFSGLASVIAGRHGGRLVKALGDGVLLTFPDAVTAVEGCLELLAALPDADLPPGHAGVHAGPIIERDGEVFGRTVNLAARVGDLAPAGSLYVTRPVITAIKHLSIADRSMGVFQLHGLGARELWCVLGHDPSE